MTEGTTPDGRSYGYAEPLDPVRSDVRAIRYSGDRDWLAHIVFRESEFVDAELQYIAELLRQTALLVRALNDGERVDETRRVAEYVLAGARSRRQSRPEVIVSD